MKLSFPDPVFTFANKSVSIRSYGAAIEFDPDKEDQEATMLQIAGFAYQSNAQNVLWQRLPNNVRSPDRRCKVGARSHLPRIDNQYVHCNEQRLDGVILSRSGDAVAFISNDCHIGVLGSRGGTDIGVFHWSRTSAQCTDLGNPGKSVLWDVINMCRSGWKGLTSVYGVLTTGIAPEHFNNEQHPHMIDELEHLYGGYERVIPDKTRATVDMVALMRAQCAIKGIGPKQIVHDGIDTYSDPRCSSLRAENDGTKPKSNLRNLVIVTKL